MLHFQTFLKSTLNVIRCFDIFPHAATAGGDVEAHGVRVRTLFSCFNPQTWMWFPAGPFLNLSVSSAVRGTKVTRMTFLVFLHLRLIENMNYSSLNKTVGVSSIIQQLFSCLFVFILIIPDVLLHLHHLFSR